MKRQVIWTDDATDELDEQIAYIAQDNEDAAERMYVRLHDAVHDLAISSTGRRGREPGTYEKVVRGTPYIIVYELPDYAPIVHIMRIFHGAQIWWGDHQRVQSQ